jgi:hypothetical protein
MPILGSSAGATKGAPGVPTSVSATSPTSTTASVSFTAPGFSKLPISSYTVTSSPGGYTGTGASSPITVSGLTAGTAYTFTVTAATAGGVSGSSSASNSVTPTTPSWYARTYVSPSGGSTFAVHYDADIKSGNTIAAGYVNASSTNHPMLTYRNNAGTVQWQKKIVNTYPWGGCKFDSAGDVLASGWSAAGYAYLVKINAAGTSIVWQKSMTISGYQPQEIGVNPVAVDSSDNVYLAGGFGYNNSYAMGGVIAKYNSSGTIQWQQRLTDSNANRVAIKGLDVDSSGNVYGAGYYSNTNANNSYFNPFVVKYNSSGTIQWQRYLIPQKTSAASQARGVAVDSSGNVYVVGEVYETAGGRYAFLAKYNSSGTFQWIRKIQQGSYQSWATDVKVDSSGTVYTLGVNFEWNASSPSGFLVRHDSDGTLLAAANGMRAGSYNSSGVAQNRLKLDTSNSKILISGSYQAENQTFDFESGWTYGFSAANLLYVPLDGTAENSFNPIYETSPFTSSNYSSLVSSTTGGLTDQVGGYTVTTESLTLSNHTVTISNTYNG